MSLRRMTGTEVEARRGGAGVGGGGGGGLTFLVGAGGGGGVATFTEGLTYHGVNICSTKTIDTHIPLVVAVNSLFACQKLIQGAWQLWIWHDLAH